MTVLEFESLELTDRLELVVEQGTPIAQIKKPRKGQLLYSLYSFYVELEMTYKAGCTDVHEAHAYYASPRLNKFLDLIDLSELGIGDQAA